MHPAHAAKRDKAPRFGITIALAVVLLTMLALPWFGPLLSRSAHFPNIPNIPNFTNNINHANSTNSANIADRSLLADSGADVGSVSGAIDNAIGDAIGIEQSPLINPITLLNTDSAAAPTLTLLSINPPVTHPGDTVTIGLRVNNDTAETLSDLTAQVRVSWQRLTTRTALSDWLATPPEHSAVTVAQQELPTLAPGTYAEISLQFHTDILGFAEALSGPRAMSVSVSDYDDILLAQENTFLVWDSTLAVESPPKHQVPISLFAPVVGPALDTLDPLPAIEALLAPPARLGTVLDAVNVAAAATGIPNALALAIDPALVGFVTGSVHDDAYPWLQKVTDAAAQTLVYPLAPFDPDWAALAHADLSEPELTLATSIPLPNNLLIPDNWRPPVAWPADWLMPDVATHEAALTAGFPLLVNPSGSRALWGTATGLDQFGTAARNMAVLINDVDIARAFTAATDPAQGNSVEALQILLAELLVVSEQYGANTPHLLIALPRDWQPNLGMLDNTLRVLDTSNWVNVAPLTSLLTRSVPNIDRLVIPNRLIHDGELPADQVQAVVAGIQKVESFTDIAADPYYVVADTDAALIIPLSVSWRTQPHPYLSRTEAVERSLAIASDISRWLTVSASGATLITAEGSIPLLVHNGFNSDVTVQVVLTPEDTRILVDDAPTITVPASAASLVYVPVRAIASGDIEVSVQLHSSDGAVVADAGLLQLRVRAGWETVGTAVIVGLLGLLMAGGITRTVRRGRSPRRANAASVTYPQINDR